MRKQKYLQKFLALVLCLLMTFSIASSAFATDGDNTQEGSYITNIALGKTATASSYESSSRQPSAANDGSTASIWAANNGNPGNWWMVDLGSVRSVLGSEIVFEIEGDVWQYIIETSTDGTVWTRAADKSNNTSGSAVQTDVYTASARYIKVTVTGVPENRWTAIAEFRVWGEQSITISGSNVARQKTATASSQENDSRGPANAVDGNSGTLWIANGGDAGNWLKVDLGGRFAINTLRLTFEDGNRVWRYKMQTSLNNVDWITVYDNTANNLALQTHTAPVDITAQYVRVVFEAAPGSAWTALAELEVFGVAAPAAGTSEKILVIIPHEDDEAAIAAGIIHRGILDGDSVKVAIATNGDCNGVNQSLGILRINESISAMEVLGLDKSNITVFGYADTGGFEPWTRYTDSFLYRLYHAASDTTVLSSNFGNSQTYGASGILEDYHYQQTGTHASYTRQNFVNDLTSYIGNYMPDRIYTTSAYDLHGDHAYINVFLTQILMGLIAENPGYAPVMYESIVHSTQGDVDWPVIDSDPTPMQPFTAPANLAQTPLVWENRVSVPLPGDMLTIPRSTNMKNVCLRAYSSQYNSYIGSFAKADEIFWAKDFSNLAYKASITASSSSTGASAACIADGLIGGYEQLPDCDWMAANETTGAWVQMSWSEGQSIKKLVLHGCMDSASAVTGGTLSFSDGTSITVGALPAYGKPLMVPVDLNNISWVRFTVTGASGESVGLAEWEVY